MSTTGDERPPGSPDLGDEVQPQLDEEDCPTPRVWIYKETREVNEDGMVSERVIVEIIHPDGKEELFMF